MKNPRIQSRILCLLQQEEGTLFADPPTSFNSNLVDRDNVRSNYEFRLNNLLNANSKAEAPIAQLRKLLEHIDKISDDKIRLTTLSANGLVFGVFTDTEATRLFCVLTTTGQSNHMGFHQQ